MTDQDKLTETAVNEMAYHYNQQVHYRALIDRLMVNLGYHERQEDLWTEYLSNLGDVAVSGAEVVPFVPKQRHLRLVGEVE